MIASFLKDETAATAVEYGLIVAVISLAVAAGIGAYSGAMKNMFGYFANILDDAGN